MDTRDCERAVGPVNRPWLVAFALPLAGACAGRVVEVYSRDTNGLELVCRSSSGQIELSVHNASPSSVWVQDAPWLPLVHLDERGVVVSVGASELGPQFVNPGPVAAPEIALIEVEPAHTLHYRADPCAVSSRWGYGSRPRVAHGVTCLVRYVLDDPLTTEPLFSRYSGRAAAMPGLEVGASQRTRCRSVAEGH